MLECESKTCGKETQQVLNFLVISPTRRGFFGSNMNPESELALNLNTTHIQERVAGSRALQTNKAQPDKTRARFEPTRAAGERTRTK